MTRSYWIFLFVVLLIVKYGVDSRLIHESEQDTEITKKYNFVSTARRMLNSDLEVSQTKEINLNDPEESESTRGIRTATGGIVNTIMIILTCIAFAGNGAFLVYVFWLSK